MAFGQVGDVDVIAHAGAVGGVVVAAEHLQAFIALRQWIARREAGKP